MLKPTKMSYEKLIKYTIKIQKLYDKLYELDVSGKADSEGYKQIIEYIKLSKYIEDNEYNKIFTNYQVFEEFNDIYMEEFYNMIEDYSSIDLIFANQDMMPFQRIDTKFNRCLAVSEFLDKKIAESIEYDEDDTDDYEIYEVIEALVGNRNQNVDDEMESAAGSNYLMFNMYADSKFYKNTIQLLKHKLNEYAYTDNRYRILAKYYYGIIYMHESAEEMFLNNTKENLREFPRFIDSLPNSRIKSNYNQILAESSMDQITYLLQGIILGDFPNTEYYSQKEIETLYNVILENVILLTTKSTLEQLEPILENNINMICSFAGMSNEQESDITQKVKTIINKTKEMT